MLGLPADKSLIDQNLRHLVKFLQALQISRVKLGSSVSSLALKEIPLKQERELALVAGDGGGGGEAGAGLGLADVEEAHHA